MNELGPNEEELGKLSPEDREMMEVGDKLPEEQASPEKEEQKPPVDALIVFGFGIANPTETDDSQKKGWMLGVGAKLRVQAAAELYLRGQVREVIFTGGATRQKDEIQETEAGLMEQYFRHILGKRKKEQLLAEARAAGEDPQAKREEIESAVEGYLAGLGGHLVQEGAATNTIENFSRTIDRFDQNPDQYQNIALLSNRFHITRIGELAGMFGVKGKKFNAEEMVAYAASDRGRHEKEYRDLLDRATDPNFNEEYRNFLVNENRWRGGLKEVPEYFLPQTVFLGGRRLRDVLRTLSEQEKIFEEALTRAGIPVGEIDSMDEQELRDRISKIDRVLPPEKWASTTPEWYDREGEK